MLEKKLKLILDGFYIPGRLSHHLSDFGIVSFIAHKY